MINKIDQFDRLLSQIKISKKFFEIDDFELKLTQKWSKKEILGHLVDSAINNIQRFTEIQYLEKPYIIRKYQQDELVQSNNYQNKNSDDLINLWLQLNSHILYLINNQTKETLSYQIILPNQEMSNFKFLIEDYLNHLFYHLKQINHEF
ncbi:DinB family protein [Flavobacterium sp.]|uniref:DinB family protein n=1 Tax=Flavobacterium sp. TaxID=239 RepID=UPI003528545F